MALRDYIRCKECDCKLVPDGDEVGREHIDSIWGCTEKEHYWKSVLLCPDCINKLEQRLAAAESRTCELQEDSDSDSGAWLGDCGAKWTFIVGGPEENSCVYCPQCGGKLVVSECQVKEDSGKGGE